MKKLRELCKWEVFNPYGGNFYVVVNPEDGYKPISSLHDNTYHHWNEFPEYVEVIGMMFLVPDK